MPLQVEPEPFDEVIPRVYGPAMALDEMSHAVQDAYTHTLRDDDLQIVTVLNFVDPVLARDKEDRDGLPHSDRLDECDVPGDEFDVLRVTAARRATVELLTVAFDALEAGEGAEALSPALDRVYQYREGCDRENAYCATEWLAPAREGFTEPIRLWFCGARAGHTMPWGLLALVGLSGWGLRRRRRGAGGRPR